MKAHITEVENPDFANGDRVKINYDKICEEYNYKSLTDKFKKWIKDNKDRVFTVCEYSGYGSSYNSQKLKKIKHELYYFAEDTTEPKWLFWAGFLEHCNTKEE